MEYQQSPVAGYTRQRYEQIRNMVWYNIVSKLTTDDNVSAAFISEENMVYWLRCFTSPLSSSDNYETLETLGDSGLDSYIKYKLFTDDPYVDPDDLSRVVTYYGRNDFIHYEIMSRLVFTDEAGNKSTFFNYLDVNPQLLIDDSLITKLQADLYEAILGTIKIVVDITFNGRLGHDFSYNWFVYTFEFAGFTRLRTDVGNSVTILHQIFSRFSEVGITIKEHKSVKDDFSVGNRTVIGVRYYLEPADLAKLYKLIGGSFSGLTPRENLYLVRNDYLPPSSFGLNKSATGNYVIGDVKDTAIENAAEEALRFLNEKFGVNSKWATAKKSEIEVEQIFPANSPERRKFEEKKRKDNFVSVQAKKLTKFSTEGLTVLQFIGVRPVKPGHTIGEQVLIKATVGRHIVDMKRKLFFDYIEM